MIVFLIAASVLFLWDKIDEEDIMMKGMLIKKEFPKRATPQVLEEIMANALVLYEEFM